MADYFRTALTILMIGFATTAFSQAKVTWNVLADVKYEPKYFEAYNDEFLAPTFGKTPTAFDGKDVLITGYIIPLDAEGSVYILSKNPYASCFFCGNAGPETIVELWIQPKNLKRYQTDQRLTFRGKLRLNDDDVEHFNYILMDAKEY